MKNLLKAILGLIAWALMIIACDDNNIPNPFASAPVVRFETSEGVMKKNDTEPTSIMSSGVNHINERR